MKLLKPNLKVSLATTAVAFLAGAALVLSPSSQKSQGIHLADSTTTPTTSQSDPSTTTTDPSTQGTDTTSGTTSSSTGTSTTPSGSTSSPTTGSTSTSGTTDQTQAPNDPAPAVVAVSAQLGDWVSQTTSSGYTSTTVGENNSLGWYTEQYQYCVYTYSDSSTQQALYQTREYWNNGSVTNQAVVGSSCDISNAPAAN